MSAAVSRTMDLGRKLSDLAIDVEYAKLHNLGPARFSYAQQNLRIEPLHLIGEGTDVTAHGSCSLRERKRIDLAADRQVDLLILRLAGPKSYTSGVLTIHMNAVGMARILCRKGRFKSENGAATMPGSAQWPERNERHADCFPGPIHIEQLTARSGGGNLDLKGDVTNHNRQFNLI